MSTHLRGIQAGIYGHVRCRRLCSFSWLLFRPGSDSRTGPELCRVPRTQCNHTNMGIFSLLNRTNLNGERGAIRNIGIYPAVCT